MCSWQINDDDDDIIVVIVGVITDQDAVADGIFLAVHVLFRFADIDTFFTNLRFALHCFLQTHSHFHCDMYTVSQKISPTFLAVSRESIVGFS